MILYGYYMKGAPMTYEIENIAELDEKAIRKKTGKIATKSFSRAYFGLVLYTFVAGLVIIAAGIAMAAFLGEDGMVNAMESPYVSWGLQILSMYVVAFPIFVRYMRPVPKMPPLRDEKLGFINFMRLVFVSYFAMTVGNYISIVITSLIGEGSVLSATSSPLDAIEDAPTIVAILVVVIIAPIFEELIFRRTLINCLGKYGEKLAIAVTSVAFGLFHGNLSQFIYATIVGFILGITYVKTGRIRYSILLHMAANFLGTAVPLVLEKASLYISNASDTNSTKYIIANIACYAIPVFLVICTVLGFIVLIRSRMTGIFKCDYQCEIELSPMRKIRSVILNLGAIIFLLTFVSSILASLIPIEQLFNMEEVNIGAETAYNIIF